MVFKIKNTNMDPHRLSQRMAGFYGITSDKYKELGWDHVKCAQTLLESGVRTVQLLFNDFPEYGRALEDARRIRKLCDAHDALFLITVYHKPLKALALVKDSDADGMHYHMVSASLGLPLEEGRRQLKGKVMGITVRNGAEAKVAEAAGADYVGSDPVFPSLRHRPGNAPIGLEGLKGIVDAVSVPTIAVGGIMPRHLQEIKRIGAIGFVTMSPVYKPEQGKTPESVVAEYMKAWNES
ncbi:MAG: thiamine phosphate synthase [Candidatus Micrarchaeota archaeon]|nr:thiamine phosphate synthase [Candidatus Micrarchaeota archaeon]